MRTRIISLLLCLYISFPVTGIAGGGQTIFHAFTLEVDVGESREGTLFAWDFDGWIGGDTNKLWLKSEGEKIQGQSAEQAEFWAMYSHNIATFWDAQIGVRFDEQPDNTSYLVIGIEGLAPYFFETEAHIFVSKDSDITARLRQEIEFLLTQRFIIEPYAEFNFSAQDIPKLEVGTGVTSGEFGIQTRYEISRKFAPYIDLHYERQFGETSIIAQNEGEKRDDFVASVGLYLMF